MTKAAFSGQNFDLIWCCEVVEHVEEEFVQNIMDTFKLGKIVALTHAVPGQKGYHHVNCKPKEYWIDLMISDNFKYLEKRPPRPKPSRLEATSKKAVWYS